MIISFNIVLFDAPNYQQNILGFLVLGLCCVTAGGSSNSDFVLPRRQNKMALQIKCGPWARV